MVDSATTSAHSKSAVSDELLDELDASMHQLGRLLSMRHGPSGEEHACDVSGPRLLALQLVSTQGAMRQGDMAALLGVKAPAVSAMVDSLVEAGLVEREADPDDRRATLVAVTELGKVRLGEIEAERRTYMRTYVSVLSEDDVRSLIRIQRVLIDSMVSGRI